MTDIDHPYLSSGFREALGALYYGLEYGNRILMLSSGPGLGKTTLLHYFERRMRERGHTLFLTSDDHSLTPVLNRLVAALGGTPSGDSRTMQTRADELLTKIAEAENPFVLLLDCDNSAAGALDMVSSVAPLGAFKKGALRFVIGASNRVAEELQRSEFGNDVRRVPLSPLSAAEVETYIEYELRLAGWQDGRPLTDKACKLIAERSSGNPASINQICFNLLGHLRERGDSHRRDAKTGLGLIVDDSEIERLIPDAKPDENGLASPTNPTVDSKLHRSFPAARSVAVSEWPFSPRTAVLACIVLIAAIIIAGLWYGNATKSHPPKPATDKNAALLTVPSQALVHRDLLRQAPNPAIADNRTQGHVLAAQPPVPTLRTRDTQKVPSVMPASAASIASPDPETTVKSATTKIHLATKPAALVSSLSARASNEGSNSSAQAFAAKTQKMPAAPPLRAAVASPNPSSSSGEQQVTVASGRTWLKSPAAAPPVTARGDNDQLTAYEIRLGDDYMNDGHYDKAIQSFSRALALTPGNEDAQEKLIRARRAKIAEESVLH